MTAAYARALALFESAIGLREPDRSRYLEAACAGDDELRVRVSAMLEADAGDHDVLDRSPIRRAPHRSSVEDYRGLRVGPYRLTTELGRGGMGVVYLGERSDVGSRVAIKLLTDTYATPERRARFQYERRVLAGLEHPSIARFLDAGISDRGMLWFAMEYVEGRQLLEHCDVHRLDVHERIALFEQIADAVAYAHRNLLVHRDLKPSNIVVSDDGQPKLLDFGIAKLVGVDTPDALTRDPAAAPMTPSYASPEQVRHEPITTATDVYQLGILLHELLTGRKPASPDGRPLRSFERATCERFLRPGDLVLSEVMPAQIASGPTDRTAADLAALRRSTPRQLSRRLTGDLDAIIQTSLSCRPQERYGSARELSEDLVRHREGRPISARAPSLAYRAARFVRRHTASTILAASLAVLVSAAALLFLAQASTVRRERDRVERVGQVLERMVAATFPGAQAGDSVRTTVLREAAAEARANLPEDPVRWGRILALVGGVYEEEGQVDTAVAIWREALEGMQSGVEPDDSLILDVTGRLGVALVTLGDFDAGLEHLEAALGRARSLSPERSADLAGTLYDTGFGRQIAGDDATARRLYHESIALLTSLPDSGGVSYDRALVNLGYIAERTGDPDSAEALFRHALERRRPRDGDTHSRTLNAMTSLARILIAQGRLDEADTLSLMALEGRRAMLPSVNAGLADATEVRALYLIRRGGGAEAEGLARASLAYYRQLFDDDHFIIGHALSTVAAAVATRGRDAEAAAIQRDATARYRSSVGDGHPGTLHAMIALADYEQRIGRTAAAEGLYRLAIPPFDSITGGRPVIAPALARFGMLLAGSGRCDEAVSYLRRAARLADGSPDWNDGLDGTRSALSRCTNRE